VLHFNVVPPITLATTPLCHVRGHGWRQAQGLIDTHKIVVFQMRCRLQFFQLLAEGIGQACKALHTHLHGVILSLDHPR
jgi:hypothetical protein